MQQAFVFGQSIIPFFAGSMISEEVANQMDKIDFYIECDWYQLPYNIRLMLPLIIANTQKPCVFKLYGKFVSNRESFKEVISFKIIKTI